jgi:hypothetical protein
MRRVHHVLCVACLLAPLPASAQTGIKPGRAIQSPVPAGDAGSIVDVRKIDPDTFRAIAARLPKGRAPKIDGRLEDEEWKLAGASGNFIQREPSFGAPSTERTEFKILYDDRKIYFAVWAYDSDPSGITASELKRDSGLQKGDQIKIKIDTFNDHRNSFGFYTNPLGAYKDNYAADNGRLVNYDWNAVWECKTSRDERGWYVEIAIPLSQLRFKSSPAETVWGLNVCRVIIRKQEETYWVPFPREWGAFGFSRVASAGHLLGLEGLRARRQFELVPFVVPQVSRDFDAGTATSGSAKYGFDLRLGLTSNVTADLTYRTDFAQVEADQEVVNTTRFSLFFPEKRQFFTESAGIFDFGRGSGVNTQGQDTSSESATAGLLGVFYSRRVGLDEGREVPIIGGGKVTGRTGSYTFGLMNVETDRTSYRSTSGAEVDVPRANYSALRVKRNVMSQSFIGGVVLNRQGGARTAFNRTVGVDAGFLLGKATEITGLLAKTFSPDTSGRDLAGALDFSWKNDRFSYGATYLDVGERFNAEMGYIPRTDIRNLSGQAAWTPRPKWRGVRQLTFAAATDYFENHRGQPDTRTETASFSLAQQNGARFATSVTRDYDMLPYNWTIGPGRTIPTGGYTWDTFKASYSTNSSKRLFGGPSIQLGSYYNGSKRSYKLTLNFLPLGELLVETNYTHNTIILPGAPAYDTNTLNLRVSYPFSANLFVKGFFQYNDDRRLASLNFLFWYIYRPGSDLYVVFNEGWNTDLPGPQAFAVKNRSLAIKMTYWLSR